MKSVKNEKYFGVDHDVNGTIYQNVIAIYDKDFKKDDKIIIDRGPNVIRYAILGDVTPIYQLLRNQMISNDMRNTNDYVNCVQQTVFSYFGNYYEKNKRISYFPTNIEIEKKGKKVGAIADLAHKNVAYGIERAVVSQNLLAEIGFITTFKICNTEVNGDICVHAINLIKHDGKCFIFDSNFPTVHNGRAFPIVCEIPEEVYNKMIIPDKEDGYSVVVKHVSPLDDVEYNIIYDVGREKLYNPSKSKSKKLVKK